MSVKNIAIPPIHRIAADKAALPPNVQLKGARGRILDAALHLFAQKSYSGTSVRDICGMAKVQLTTLYGHFPSKEHVLAEIVQIGHEELFRSLRQGLMTSRPEPIEQLRALVKAHVTAHCIYSMLAVVANSELHMLTPELSAPAMALLKQSGELVAEVFQRGQLSGDFQLVDPELTSRAIGGMGMRVAFWYDPAAYPPVEQVAETYATLACRMVGAKA